MNITVRTAGWPGPCRPHTRGSLLVQRGFALHALGDSEAALDILDPLRTAPGDSLRTQGNAYVAAAFIRSARRRQSATG